MTDVIHVGVKSVAAADSINARALQKDDTSTTTQAHSKREIDDGERGSHRRTAVSGWSSMGQTHEHGDVLTTIGFVWIGPIQIFWQTHTHTKQASFGVIGIWLLLSRVANALER